MKKRLLSLYNLKFNPFSPDLPVQALHVTPAIESFCWRIEHQLAEGGFALVLGETGTGKSAALRILSERLQALPDAAVGILTRPHAMVGDFYRELGHLFGVQLSPHNRWVGASALRAKWLAHIEGSLHRPVLLVDEAQEMRPCVLCELRLLASAELDSRPILTVVLAGDERLNAKLNTPELIPVASRVRARLRTEHASVQHLGDCLRHALATAGNPKLFDPELAAALCEHAAGNHRILMNMANDLLSAALQRELDHIDRKLFHEVFALDAKPSAKARS